MRGRRHRRSVTGYRRFVRNHRVSNAIAPLVEWYCSLHKWIIVLWVLVVINQIKKQIRVALKPESKKMEGNLEEMISRSNK